MIDTWYDSGAMPYAQWGYHPELGRGLERFEEYFPADFISEAIDQTRGWFYTLMAEGVLLFDSTTYRDGGVPRPPRRPGRAQDVEVARQHRRRVRGDGSAGRRRAPLVPAHRRLAVVTAPGEHGDVRRRRPAVPVAAVERLRVLRHVRERERVRPVATATSPSSGDPLLDRWVLSQLSRTEAVARDGLQAYDATGAGRRIAAFVEDLSNWYVRRARRRFWDPAGEGRRRRARGVPHAARVPRQPVPAARSVHPVRRGDPVAQPGRRSRRRAGLRAPVGLPERGRASAWTRRSTTRWPRSARSSSSAAGSAPRPRCASVSRLLEAVVHYRRGPRGARAAPRPGRRGAEREAGAVRRVRRRSSGAGARSRTSRCSAPGSDPGSRTPRRRSNATTGRSPPRSPTARPFASTSGATRSSSRPATSTSSRRRSRGGGSRATAASPSRSSSSSRPSSGPRVWPASWCAPCRTRARPPASTSATASCSVCVSRAPPWRRSGRTADGSPRETLAVDVVDGAAPGATFEQTFEIEGAAVGVSLREA